MRALTLALAVLAGAPALAMQNEPTDFRGIQWGAPVEKHQQELVRLGDVDEPAFFKRANEQLTYAGIDVRRITYRFFKNRFSAGTILTVGTSNKNSMVSFLSERYGPASYAGVRHPVYRWDGERIVISVTCDISYGCYTEFYDKALRAEEESAGVAPAPARRDDD